MGTENSERSKISSHIFYHIIKTVTKKIAEVRETNGVVNKRIKEKFVRHLFIDVGDYGLYLST